MCVCVCVSRPETKFRGQQGSRVAVLPPQHNQCDNVIEIYTVATLQQYILLVNLSQSNWCNTMLSLQSTKGMLPKLYKATEAQPSCHGPHVPVFCFFFFLVFTALLLCFWSCCQLLFINVTLSSVCSHLPQLECISLCLIFSFCFLCLVSVILVTCSPQMSPLASRYLMAI